MKSGAKIYTGASKKNLMPGYILLRSLSADLKAMRDWYAAGSTGRLFQSRMVRGKNELA